MADGTVSASIRQTRAERLGNSRPLILSRGVGGEGGCSRSSPVAPAIPAALQTATIKVQACPPGFFIITS